MTKAINYLDLVLSSEVVVSQVVSADFIKELLPAAQKTALLYHMSYLCLANFPTLEKIIRANALEAQMLFSSSEALLLRVSSLGSIRSALVTSSFPGSKIVASSLSRSKKTAH